MRSFDDSIGGALKYAFKLLNYRDRSRKELQDKLTRKGFSKNAAEDALAYLDERGFINDGRLAGILMRDALERRHLGKRGAANYLASRGIAKEIINSVLIEEHDYAGSARKLVEKKLKHMKNCDEKAIKRRLWGMLDRKGFSSDIINTVIKSLNLKEEIQ